MSALSYVCLVLALSATVRYEVVQMLGVTLGCAVWMTVVSDPGLLSLVCRKLAALVLSLVLWVWLRTAVCLLLLTSLLVVVVVTTVRISSSTLRRCGLVSAAAVVGGGVGGWVVTVGGGGGGMVRVGGIGGVVIGVVDFVLLDVVFPPSQRL